MRKKLGSKPQPFVATDFETIQKITVSWTAAFGVLAEDMHNWKCTEENALSSLLQTV